MKGITRIISLTDVTMSQHIVEIILFTNHFKSIIKHQAIVQSYIDYIVCQCTELGSKNKLRKKIRIV